MGDLIDTEKICDNLELERNNFLTQQRQLHVLSKDRLAARLIVATWKLTVLKTNLSSFTLFCDLLDLNLTFNVKTGVFRKLHKYKQK